HDVDLIEKIFRLLAAFVQTRVGGFLLNQRECSAPRLVHAPDTDADGCSLELRRRYACQSAPRVLEGSDGHGAAVQSPPTFASLFLQYSAHAEAKCFFSPGVFRPPQAGKPLQQHYRISGCAELSCRVANHQILAVIGTLSDTFTHEPQACPRPFQFRAHVVYDRVASSATNISRTICIGESRSFDITVPVNR